MAGADHGSARLVTGIELTGDPEIGLRREVVTSVRHHSHEDPPQGDD
jgi:hypothetical protein